MESKVAFVNPIELSFGKPYTIDLLKFPEIACMLVLQRSVNRPLPVCVLWVQLSPDCTTKYFSLQPIRMCINTVKQQVDLLFMISYISEVGSSKSIGFVFINKYAMPGQY